MAVTPEREVPKPGKRFLKFPLGGGISPPPPPHPRFPCADVIRTKVCVRPAHASLFQKKRQSDGIAFLEGGKYIPEAKYPIVRLSLD
jgi:hypothetical protein